LLLPPLPPWLKFLRVGEGEGLPWAARG
jgi:hypothetical protein